MELRLKGEYQYNITIQNMFHTYKTSYRNSNLITDEGLKFLVSKWNSEGGDITQIILGTNTKEPSPTDTIDTFHNHYIFNVDCHTEDNCFMMNTTNLSGKHLNNTREIGVIATNLTQFNDEYEDEEDASVVLVSRSTHPLISIPSTALINIEYKYTLTSVESDNC